MKKEAQKTQDVEILKKLESLWERQGKIEKILLKNHSDYKFDPDDLELAIEAINVWLTDIEHIIDTPSEVLSLKERLSAIMQRVGSGLLWVFLKQSKKRGYPELGKD